MTEKKRERFGGGDPGCYATTGQGEHLNCPTGPKPPSDNKKQFGKLSNLISCPTCGQRFPAFNNLVYCSPYCRKVKAPAVYRFVCPDGRSYVGSGLDIRKRDHHGIARKNPRLTKAFKNHPPETWRFEILETLPPACAVEALRAAEQRHIDRLGTFRESKGFNMRPALNSNLKIRTDWRVSDGRS